uniref:Ig-like domain-containing protein n=1 Tax=Xenopus tropicalis TaxID=8364 RepID=A0A803JG53_XENTR
MEQSPSVMERDDSSETVWAMRINFHTICFLLLLKESLGQQKLKLFSFPETMPALRGSCVEIPCIIHDPARANVKWYMYDGDRHHVIVDIDNASSVLSHYKHRASLVQSTELNCTLRIDNVRAGDGKYYYPGLDNVTAYHLNQGMVKINVIRFPSQTSLTKPQEIAEGTLADVTCSVKHTCASRPPKFKWNKETYFIDPKSTPQSTENPEITASSEIKMFPKDWDDGTQIQCQVTFPNGQISWRFLPIRVKYPPKNTTVAIVGDPDIQEGDNVTLSCISKAYPDIRTYLWFKGMGPGGPAGEGLEITLRNVTWPTEPYFCTAENPQGKGKSPPMDIPVKYAAKGVKIIKYENRDGSTELQCQVSSSNPAVTHFTWLRDQIPLITQNNPSLLLNNSEINSGEYECIAHNLIGNASSDGKISIVMKVEIPNDTEGDSELPSATSSLYGIIALLPILLILFFILRRLKIKWCPFNQGRTNEGTQCSEPIYLEIKEKGTTAEYSDFKGSQSTDNPYTPLHLQDKQPYGEIKGSQSTDNPYTPLHLQDKQPYGEIKTGTPEQNDPK